MSFLDLIEKTREKPEAAKKTIAIFWTVFVTGIIAIIWLGIFTLSTGNTKKNVEKYENPFGVIKESVKSFKF